LHTYRYILAATLDHVNILTSICARNRIIYCIVKIRPQKRKIELWGRTEAAVIGKHVFEALPEACGQGLETNFICCYNSGETFRASEMPVVLERNGTQETVYQNFVYEPYRNAEGRVLGVIAITIDVTEQVTARLKIEAKAKQFRFSLDAMPQQVWTACTDGSLDYVNKIVTTNFGQAADVIVGEGWQSFVHPEDLAGASDRWQRSLKTKKQCLTEFDSNLQMVIIIGT
jgi:PAS domain-containing protein